MKTFPTALVAVLSTVSIAGADTVINGDFEQIAGTAPWIGEAESVLLLPAIELEPTPHCAFARIGPSTNASVERTSIRQGAIHFCHCDDTQYATFSFDIRAIGTRPIRKTVHVWSDPTDEQIFVLPNDTGGSWQECHFVSIPITDLNDPGDVKIKFEMLNASADTMCQPIRAEELHVDNVRCLVTDTDLTTLFLAGPSPCSDSSSVATGFPGAGVGCPQVSSCADAEPACPADLDCNGVVNANDRKQLVKSYGPCVPGSCCKGDLDNDGDVDIDDLMILEFSLGPCPDDD